MVNISDFSSLFREYYNYYQKYKTIYGDKTVILYQNGGFIELYDYPLNDSEYMCGDIYLLSNICSWSVTKKIKKKNYHLKMF